jgi:predicted nuclease of predicted toxin-antitoxin system
MIQIRLLLDEDVHTNLAQALWKRGYDAVHVLELERTGYSDRQQLEFAISQGRCLLSFNVRDFVILHNAFMVNDQEHWGIFVSPQLPIGEILRRSLAILSINSAEQVQNRLEFL